MANGQGTLDVRQTYLARIERLVDGDYLAWAWLRGDLTPHPVRIPRSAFPEEPAPQSTWRCVITGEGPDTVVIATVASSTPEWQEDERRLAEVSAEIEEALRQEEEGEE